MQSLLPLLYVVLVALGICVVAWLVLLPVRWHAERKLRAAKAELAAAERELMEAKANLVIEQATEDLIHALRRGELD